MLTTCFDNDILTFEATVVTLQEELPSLASSRSGPRDADPRFVEAMGGDKLLQEVPVDEK